MRLKTRANIFWWMWHQYCAERARQKEESMGNVDKWVTLRMVDAPLTTALWLLWELKDTPEGRLAYHCVHEAMKRLADPSRVPDVSTHAALEADKAHFENLLPKFYQAMKKNEEGI